MSGSSIYQTEDRAFHNLNDMYAVSVRELLSYLLPSIFKQYTGLYCS